MFASAKLVDKAVVIRIGVRRAWARASRTYGTQNCIRHIVLLAAIVMTLEYHWSSTSSIFHRIHQISDTKLARASSGGIPNTGGPLGDGNSTTCGVPDGSRSYYALDHVREELRGNVIEANELLTDAITASVAKERVQISRAAAVYIPPGEKSFLEELKWFYLSMAIVRRNQPADLKTDLLVFTSPGSPAMALAESLGCTATKRTSFADPERCTVIEYVGLAARVNSTDPLRAYWRYVDSVNILAEYKDYGSYDYLLRTDVDTFLTPGFANWKLPDGVTIATGHGGYGSPNVDARLQWISKVQFGFTESVHVRNIGSTWYGDAAVVVALAQLSTAVMRWLDTQHFTEFEKRPTLALWPHWYWYVLTMYGGHVAVNQVPYGMVQMYSKGTMEVDAESHLDQPLTECIRHIHAWGHIQTVFSKVKFHMGEYANLDLSNYTGMTTMQAYVTTIAISSLRLSPEELKAAVESPDIIQSGAWMRVEPSGAT